MKIFKILAKDLIKPDQSKSTDSPLGSRGFLFKTNYEKFFQA